MIWTNLKIETLYFLWFNVSRLLFVTFFIQYFKATISFIWFNFLRFFLSFTHKKLFAFLFTLITSTALYTHAYNPSCHLISNMLIQKQCHLPLVFQRHVHNFNIVVPFDSNPCEYVDYDQGRGIAFFYSNDGSLRFLCWSRTLLILWRLWFTLSLWVYEILVWESHKCILF